MRKTARRGALLLLVTAAGCGDELLPPPDDLASGGCTVDTDCGPHGLCVQRICLQPFIEDLSVGVRDLASSDLICNPPECCPKGQRACGQRCIADGACCTNADCPAIGQLCQLDGTCACPPNLKLCDKTCVAPVACCVGADCMSGVCEMNKCIAPTCADGVKNAAETDIDCGGGGKCNACAVGRACGADGDCLSNRCIAGSCREIGFNVAVYGGGADPVSLLDADLDRDAILDLVTVNRASNSVTVLRGAPKAAFSVTGSYFAVRSPQRGVLADFNADMNPDIACVGGGGDVSVLLGKGDGTFTPSGTWLVGAKPVGLAAADLDSDSKIDLAIANSGSSNVTILRGDGNGGFGNPLTVPNLRGASGLLAADLDGDFTTDLAVTTPGNQRLAILLGRGQGVFINTFDYVNSNGAGHLLLSDVNRDGRLDLLAGGAGLGVYQGGGNGMFLMAGVIVGDNYPFLDAGDFNGDNVPDVIGALGIHLGMGNGTFMGTVPYPGLGKGAAVGTIGDFDADGKQDVAFVPADRKTALLTILGNGSGEFSGPGQGGTQAALDVVTPSGVAIADLDSNGQSDVLLSSLNDGVLVFLAGPGGALGAPVIYPAGGKPRGITTGDIDGDGKLDVLVTSSVDKAWSVLLGDGKGALQPALTVMGGSVLARPVLTDLDGNNMADLVAAVVGGTTFEVRNGDGKGGFALIASPAPSAGEVDSLLSADLDSDGKKDVLAAVSAIAAVFWYPGQGNGTLPFKNTFTLQANVMPRAVTTGDIDRDGKLDVLYSNAGKEIHVLLASGMWKVAGVSPVGLGGASIAVADFDRDGKLDVASHNANGLDLLRGKGDGTFLPRISYTAATGAMACEVGDVDGNGKPDLILPSATGNDLKVLRNVF